MASSSSMNKLGVGGFWPRPTSAGSVDTRESFIPPYTINKMSRSPFEFQGNMPRVKQTARQHRKNIPQQTTSIQTSYDWSRHLNYGQVSPSLSEDEEIFHNKGCYDEAVTMDVDRNPSTADNNMEGEQEDVGLSYNAEEESLQIGDEFINVRGKKPIQVESDDDVSGSSVGKHDYAASHHNDEEVGGSQVDDDADLDEYGEVAGDYDVDSDEAES